MRLSEILALEDLSPLGTYTLLQLIHRRVQCLDDAENSLAGLGELVAKGYATVTIDISTAKDHRKSNRVNLLNGTTESPRSTEDGPRPSPEPHNEGHSEPSRVPPSDPPDSSTKPKRSEVVTHLEGALKCFDKRGRSKPKASKVVEKLRKDTEVHKAVNWAFGGVNSVRESVGVTTLPDPYDPATGVESLIRLAVFCLKHGVDVSEYVAVIYEQTRWQGNAFPSLNCIAGDWAMGTYWGNRKGDRRGSLGPSADARVTMEERKSSMGPRLALKGIVEEGQEAFYFQKVEALLDSPAELLEGLRQARESGGTEDKLIQIVKAVGTVMDLPPWLNATIETFKGGN